MLQGLCLLLLVLAQGHTAVATYGPAGSSFALVDSWPGVDLAAFVDVNSDRRTDAIVLSKSDNKLKVLFAPNVKQTNGKFSQQDLIEMQDASSLASIAVADFNGDSQADYLLVHKNTSGYSAQVHYGGSNDTKTVGPFKTQPLVCDADANLIADIYGETATGRVVYLGGPSELAERVFANSSNKWSPLSSAGFASLGLNVNPSIVVLTEDGKLDVFSNLSIAVGKLDNPAPNVVDLPNPLKDSKTIGKFVFADFNMSSSIQLLLIGCEDEACKEPHIFTSSLLHGAGWEPVDVNWNPPEGGAGTWTLATSAELADHFSTSALIGPSLGDADLDGYPDIAIGLKNDLDVNRIYPAILRNTAASNGGKVKFQAHLLPGVDVAGTETLKQIAFFDADEDGILDLFLSYEGKDNVTTYLYAQKLPKEVYFLKVMLTNGQCGSSRQCPQGVIPYGLPGYGYRASYETQGSTGGRIKSSGAFETASCCGALQLPFMTFGFGDFATYIESVPISVPGPVRQEKTHKLTFIVPNAQVVVIPYPINNPSSWQAKLFLQPLYDMKVIYIAITLLVTLLVLIIVVGVLQYLEMRSDEKERMQESQRFHFDAM